MDPFAKRTTATTGAAKAEDREPPGDATTSAPATAAEPEPASPPKAEAIRHALIQTAGGLGFSYQVEQPVLDGAGRVDLVLTRGPLVVAVEISATTPAEHEVGNLLKCLPAGFTHILHVCDATTRRRRIEELLAAQATPEERARIRCLTLRQTLEHLRELAEADRPAGASSGPPEKSVPAPPLTFAEQETLAAQMLARIAARQRRAKGESA